MEIAAAERLVAELMRQYGCASVPVHWNRSTKKFGTVAYYKGDTVPSRARLVAGEMMYINVRMYEIVSATFSRPLVAHNTPEVVANTVLHEIAHILDIRQRGFTDHSAAWAGIARRIGCTAEARFDERTTVMPKSNRAWKYVATCPTCAKDFFANRAWKHPYMHCQRCLEDHPKDHAKSIIRQREVEALPLPAVAKKRSKAAPVMAY